MKNYLNVFENYIEYNEWNGIVSDWNNSVFIYY